MKRAHRIAGNAPRLGATLAEVENVLVAKQRREFLEHLGADLTAALTVDEGDERSAGVVVDTFALVPLVLLLFLLILLSLHITQDVPRACMDRVKRVKTAVSDFAALPFLAS